jgi:hypothetical protein
MNAKQMAEQLALLGQFHQNDTLRSASGHLSTVLSAYVTQANTIRKEFTPQFHQRELAKAKATVDAELTKYRNRVAVEQRRAEPTIPRSPVTAEDARELRSYRLSGMLMAGSKQIDPVKLGVAIAQKELGLLWALKMAPAGIVDAESLAKIDRTLVERTPEQQAAQDIADGLADLVTMVERAL